MCYVLILLVCFVFFFQAEDGIRAYKVTGVQTCALPILTSSSGEDDLGGIAQDDAVRRHRAAHDRARRDDHVVAQLGPGRSEERRVGKERRARRAPDQAKRRKSTRKKERRTQERIAEGHV